MRVEDMIIGNDVICINNTKLQPIAHADEVIDEITTNNKYKIVEFDNHMNWIRVLNDKGKVEWYTINRFITIDELRHNKLNELGI